MNIIAIVLFISATVAWGFIHSVSFAQLSAFLNNKVLLTEENVSEYRNIVAKQMYLALFGIAIHVMCWGGILVGIGLGLFDMYNIFFIFAFAIVTGLISRRLKTVTIDFQSVKASNESIQSQRDKIVERWKSKALPNW